MTQKTLPHRSEVLIEETWDLESIFRSAKHWEQACQDVEAKLPDMKKYQGKLAECG